MGWRYYRHGGQKGIRVVSDIPRLSVVMPIFDCVAYLFSAIQSVLVQTCLDFELIAIDDGSTDGSSDILADFAQRDARVKIVRQANAGCTAALNRGLEKVFTPYVARMDGDDVCFPDRFAKQLAYLEAHPDCVIVGGATILMDPDGVPIIEHHPPTDHLTLDRNLLHGGGLTFTHPATMMRTEAVRRVGGYDPMLAAAQDRDLWLKLAEVGSLANLPDFVLRYRVHLQNVTHRKNEQQQRCLHAAIAAACRRRRLPVPAMPVIRPSTASTGTRAFWALQAYRAGNYANARKLAWKAVRLGPGNPRTWAALMMVLPGRLSKPVVSRAMGWQVCKR